MDQTFHQWYSRIKPQKKEYSWGEIRTLLEMCWKAARPQKKMTRSEKQNRYYWGVVCKILGDEIGYLPEEMHQLMTRQLLAYESKGEWFVKSTTQLNTKEMEIYLENVRRFAAMELSCVIPKPNETDFDYEVK